MKNCYKLRQKNNILFFSINRFENFTNIIHAFSTKRTGVSNLPFEALNLGYCQKDSIENVDTNRKLFSQALSLSDYKLISPIQTHSDIFCEVSNESNTNEINADALYTTEAGLILSIQTADCLPLILYDPKNQLIGIAHLGWKGLLNKLIIKMITSICEKYMIKPKNLIIGIGPAIQQCCYEIKEDVLNLFRKEFPFTDKCILYDDNKIKFDLLHMLLLQLWELRASQNNVFWIKLCTYCNPRYFFSYRREGPTGRLMTVICKTK